MTPLTQWLALFLASGGLVTMIKAVLMTGKVLQQIKDHDLSIKDHAVRLINIETWFAGAFPSPVRRDTRRRGDNGGIVP